MMDPPALILFAHGSRQAAWARPLEDLRDTVRARHGGRVVLAFAELQPPTVLEAAGELAAQGVEEAVVVPVFFGPGRHVSEDLPRAIAAAQVAFPGLSLRVTGTLGEEPLVLAGLADGIVAAAARKKSSPELKLPA